MTRHGMAAFLLPFSVASIALDLVKPEDGRSQAEDVR